MSPASSGRAPARDDPGDPPEGDGGSGDDSPRSAGPLDLPSDPGLLGRELVTRWRDGSLGDLSAAVALVADLARLESSNIAGPAQSLSKRYAPMLAGAVPKAGGFEPCWHNSASNHSTVTAALFWLDLLSVSRELADLDRPTQALVLEAALSPQWTATCAGRRCRWCPAVALPL